MATIGSRRQGFRLCRGGKKRKESFHILTLVGSVEGREGISGGMFVWEPDMLQTHQLVKMV